MASLKIFLGKCSLTQKRSNLLLDTKNSNISKLV